MKISKIVKSTMAVAAAALFTMSVQAGDNNPVSSTWLAPTSVAASCGYQYNVIGNPGSPSNPSSFGNVYVTLGSASASQGSLTGAQLNFTQHVNASVAAANGYQLRVATGDVCSITASAWGDADPVTGAVGENVWYTYEDRVATPIANVVMLVSNDNGATVWAFTLDSAEAAIVTGSPLTIQGSIKINVNKLP